MYTKAANEICFADVQAFLEERGRESIILDYKVDWPGDLAKVIAAMANTQGGIILIGVAEDGKDGYPREITGVDLTPGDDFLRQRVVSTAYKAIYPPVRPDVTVCPLDSDPNRAVVVIRISPSDHAPHAVDNRRRIYVRVDSQTEPHSLATLDSLEWLWHRRQQAEAGRDALIEEASERASWILNGTTSTDKSIPILRAWVVPHFYTGEEALTLGAVKTLIQSRITESIVRRWRHSFPAGRTEYRSVPSGYCTYGKDGSVSQYTELGLSGLLYSELKLDEVAPESKERGIRFPLVLSQIDGLIKFALVAYEQSQLWGLVDIQASLDHVQGVQLYGVADSLFMSDERACWSPTNLVHLVREVEDRQAVGMARPALVKKAARSLIWAFGYPWDESSFDEWFATAWRA